MKKQNELIKERLQNALLTERLTGYETLLASLKSDILTLLSGYMSLGEESVRLTMDTVGDGEYEFNLKARTLRLYDPGKMIAWEDETVY